MSACLDSWAVLAWLDGEEPAYSQVEQALATRPVMSWINGVEVACRVERDHGRGAADEVMRDMRRLLDLELPGVSRMVEVVRLKASLPIALGDCFAVATAASHHVALMTGDPELLARADLPCECIDLRG